MLLRLLLLSACAFGIGCSGGATASAGAGDGDCRMTLRQPAGDKRLVRWDGNEIVEIGATCGARSRCGVGGEQTAVYLVGPSTVRIEAGAHSWERPVVTGVDVTGAGGLRGFLASQLTVARVTEEEVEVFTTDGRVRVAPTPATAPHEAIGSVDVIGDSVAVRIGARDPCEEIVRRATWLIAGETAALVPPGAYPHVWNGELTGWEIDPGRHDELVAFPSAKVTRLVLGTFDAPAEVRLLEELVVEHGGASLRVTDGERSAVYPFSGSEALVYSRSHPFGLSLEHGLRRFTARGIEPVLPLDDGHDLAGAPLPSGASVERLQVARVDGHRLVVIERLRLPGCRLDERAHLIDTRSGERRLLASGDLLRVLPLSFAGSPAWVESPVRYSFVGGGD